MSKELIDFNSLSTNELYIFFLEQIESNNFLAVKKILLMPNLKKQLALDKNCIYLGFVNAAKSKDVRIFKSIYDSMVKEMWGFPSEVLEKAFNSACEAETIDALKFLDEKLELTKHMMKKGTNFEFSKFDMELHQQNQNAASIYCSRKVTEDFSVRLNHAANTIGLIIAAHNGSEAVVQYLLSKSTEVPKNILESAFILASYGNNFTTMTLINNYCKSNEDENIRNFKLSPLVQQYLKNTSSKELLTFFEKMLLTDSLENSLNNDVPNPTKRNKI